MNRCRHMVFLLLALALVSVPAAAQTLTGTIEGAVVDEQGGVLPGVTVTLTGRQGVQSTVTDASGQYRFVGLTPATYAVKVELAGFVPQEQRAAEVGIGKTLTVDFALKVGGLSETVEVVAGASTIDTRSASTDTSLSQDLLFNTPVYDSTSTGLMNNAPGINNLAAYGGQGTYGNALLLDGVDTRDPEGGSAWTFFDQNLIDEIQIGGLGAQAEYGGFSGAIVNTITKSGGNLFSGLFSLRYTNDSLAGDNITDDIVEANGSLAESDVVTSLVDYTVQLGGPLARDRAFFFASFQRYSEEADPTGPRTRRTEISPRINGKLTWQATPSSTFTFGIQYDQYNIEGRDGYPGTQSADNQTVTEDAPEWVWNLQWRKVFGSSTFLEAKWTGYTGYYYLDPVDPSPFTYDAAFDEYTGGGGGLYYADRGRNQVNVALTRYADAFGKHTFKFGVEIERSHVRSQYQPYGPAGYYIYAYGGVPYYQFSYGYDVEGDNHRESYYAQDQWSIGNLTLNLGLRLDHIRGYSPVLGETVYDPALAWGPRLGAAYDVTGNGNSVFRAFWGQYFEGPATGFYTAAVPGLEDYVETIINPDGSLGDSTVLIPGIQYGIADDINHPKITEANLSWEQQIARAWKLTVTGIWRETTDFVNNVIEGALWRPVTLTNRLTNQPFTGYFWDNSDETSENFFIRNVEGFQYIATDGSVILTADPNRDYKGLMLVLNRSFRDRWGLQASYVLSKAEGNVDNTGFGNWLGGNQWSSPNTLLNSQGELTNSRRHEIKLFASYQIPAIEILFSGIYTGLSGRPYTPYQQFTSGQLGLPGSGRRQIFLEPRGSQVNDFYHNFDMRFEKVFRSGVHRFGVFMDVANLFNINSVTSRQTRVPSSSIGGFTVDYQAPTAVQAARQITFGGRWSF